MEYFYDVSLQPMGILRKFYMFCISLSRARREDCVTKLFRTSFQIFENALYVCNIIEISTVGICDYGYQIHFM